MRTIVLALLFLPTPLFAQGWGTLTAAFEHDGKPTDGVTIGEKNELADVVLYLAAGRDQKVAVHPDVEKAIPKTVTLTAAGGQFDPMFAVVAPGRKLRLINSGRTGLVPNIGLLANKPTSAAVAVGGYYDYPVEVAESRPIPITCSITGTLKAYLIANANPYVAVSNAAGRIKLELVPEGEWEFVVWHGRPIALADINDKPVLLARGRVKVTIKDGAVTDLGVIRFIAPPL